MSSPQSDGQRKAESKLLISKFHWLLWAILKQITRGQNARFCPLNNQDM
jgi:hypothetical protein